MVAAHQIHALFLRCSATEKERYCFMRMRKIAVAELVNDIHATSIYLETKGSTTQSRADSDAQLHAYLRCCLIVASTGYTVKPV